VALLYSLLVLKRRGCRPDRGFWHDQRCPRPTAVTLLFAAVATSPWGIFLVADRLFDTDLRLDVRVKNTELPVPKLLWPRQLERGSRIKQIGPMSFGPF